MSEQKSFRILIVDDNPGIHDDFRKILNPVSSNPELESIERGMFGTEMQLDAEVPSYQIDSAFQGRDGLAKVDLAQRQGNPYSMAFIDMRMPPGIDGIETIERIWETGSMLQVVICTAYSDYSWQETIQRLGWSDRLLILKKPFDKMEVCQLALALSVKSELSRIASLKEEELRKMVADRTCELQAEITRRQLVEDLLLAEQSKLEVKASIDATTGLQNRGAIMDRIQHLARQASSIDQPFTILFVDIDHFKQVNDKHGHRAGDDVLKQVAHRLFAALRPTDAIGRYGGEEFVIGLLGCDREHATRIGNRLIASVSERPFRFENKVIPVTVSVGIATERLMSADAGQLLERADQALYLAKRNGRNRIECHVPV